MIKKSIYPKTNRICNNEITYEITEKIDGSNLVFAKLNGKLLICQRNYILTREELDKHNAYGGLIGWLDEYGDTLLNLLNEKSAIINEYQNNIKLNVKDISNNLNKANLEINLEQLSSNIDTLKNDTDLKIRVEILNQRLTDFINSLTNN